MITEVKAPKKYKDASIFLAGSIEHGKAEEWQKWVMRRINEEFGSNKDLNLTILNPRRDNWCDNKNDLEEQIKWELDGLASADIIAMYFDPKTISPITLLEFGLFATENIIVHCTPEYYRFTNLEVTSRLAGINLITDKEKWLEEIFNQIRELYL
jgi:hypothetical protein